MYMNLLLVDDDRFEWDGIKYLLQKMKYHFQITEARNGQAALRLLTERDIDIVITDIKMPVMDGMTFLKQAKEKTGRRLSDLQRIRRFSVCQRGDRLAGAGFSGQAGQGTGIFYGHGKRGSTCL